MAEQVADRVRVPRFPRPIATVIVLVLVIAAAGAGLAVGYRMQSNVAESIKQAQTPIETTARVASKAYAPPPITGTVSTIASFDYRTALNPGVVTRLGAQPGELVKSGSLLVAINDIPVFALRLAVSPWRDVKAGDVGSDVASLNDELNGLGLRKGGASDTYNEATTAAIEAMFTAAKLEAQGTPPGSSLPLTNITVLPPGDFIVKAAIPRGAAAGDGPVIHAVQAASQVMTVLDVVHAKTAKPGSKVEITLAGGASLGAGTVAKVGDFRAGDPKGSGLGALAGYPTTITLDKQPDAALVGGEQAQISFPSESAAQPAAPTIAIHQAGDRTWVVLKNGQKYSEVNVRPLWQQGGWTGFSSDPKIPDGSVIVLSGGPNDGK